LKKNPSSGIGPSASGDRRGIDEAAEIEDERGREDGVASLPGELHGHSMAEEALEVDEVPRGLVVAEARHVIDSHVGVGAYPRTDFNTASFDLSFDALWAGSDSTRPSRSPRMF
jgi:hypothetical protein